MKHVLLSWQLFAAVVSVAVFVTVSAVVIPHAVAQVLLSLGATPQRHAASEIQGHSTQVVYPVPLVKENSPVISFVGDILLARSVEVLMHDFGETYPFIRVPAIIGSSTATFANFEAAIPETHTHTKDYTTQFSADEKYVSELAQSGVTHVSLANNHAYDFGTLAEEHTRSALALRGVSPFGDANTVATSSITSVMLGTTTVSVLAFQTVYGQVATSTLAEVIGYMKRTSDVQIAYIHWGTEYEMTHTKAQAVLAEFLVSQGIDAIIGHHPHVVEDIQLVAGVPVFYSLGNFIFDQYFSTAVQEGLALRIEPGQSHSKFTLVPVTSIGTHAQPRVMSEPDRSSFLERLASTSDPVLKSAILQGEITIPYTLHNE